MSGEREQRLEARLEQFRQPVKRMPFEVVIKSLYGTAVETFEPDASGHRETLGLLTSAMRDACEAVRRDPIERDRPNEVGNDMERFVIRALSTRGMRAAAPVTRAGKGKSTGYPDVRVETDDLPIYLEVKNYAAKNRTTAQRSFHLSPAEDPKVKEDAHHVLVGFETQRAGDHYTPVAFEIVDLYGLVCDMKAEFNSNNTRLYENSRVLVQERV